VLRCFSHLWSPKTHAVFATKQYSSWQGRELALLYDAQGPYSEAEPLSQRALAILEKVLEPEHPSTRTVLENYAAHKKQAKTD
jgi:hypothetical protein